MTALFAQSPFPDWAWLANPRTHERLVTMLSQHTKLTLSAVLVGFAVATPLAVLAVHQRWLAIPLLSLTGVLYTIPALALFVLVGGLLGIWIGWLPALTGLVVYSLLILFRNGVAGLSNVAPDVAESAAAMGHTRFQQLLRVELPVALPVIMAGVRIATVSTIGLVTITAFVGMGGFGQLFIIGFTRRNTTIVLTGIVACAILAIIADLALMALQRRLMPWSRER